MDNAKTSTSFMEVMFVEAKKLMNAIGTLVIVGAVSAAGAALWTNILDDKLKLAKAKKIHSESGKIIIVDFKKAGRGSSR